MSDKEKKYLIKKLKILKYEGFLQQKDVFIYFLQVYIRSLLKFGISNEVTKDTIRIYKQLKEIQQKDYEIHDFIKRNALEINEIATNELLEQLDELNVKTKKYYYDAFEDIITACDLKNDIYAKHKDKDFDTLNETNAYKLAAASLLITFEDLKQLLDFEKEFWKYIEKRIIFKSSYISTKYTISIIPDENNNVKDFDLIIPEMVDIFSVKKCIELISYAYVLYTYIGREIDDEEISNIPEEEKINEYILKKFK